jgi:hypothetical protein
MRALWPGGARQRRAIRRPPIDTKIKEFLFCPGFGPCQPIPPDGFQLLVIAQNLFSITCVFFIGLALRNYFRIK